MRSAKIKYITKRMCAACVVRRVIRPSHNANVFSPSRFICTKRRVRISYWRAPFMQISVTYNVYTGRAGIHCCVPNGHLETRSVCALQTFIITCRWVYYVEMLKFSLKIYDKKFVWFCCLITNEHEASVRKLDSASARTVHAKRNEICDDV